MSNFFLLQDLIAEERRRCEKDRVYPTAEETRQAQSIRDGKLCKTQQRQGLAPGHDSSSCYVCEQFEKAKGGKR